MTPEIRLYIDEIGHHDMKSSTDENQRYLGLSGILMRLEYAGGEFSENLRLLKHDIFGRSDFPLHRREILNGSPEPYTRLKDEGTRSKFNERLLRLLEDSKYRVFSVVIDKREHKTKYVVWQFQPYHYCMTVMLERYVQWLGRVGCVGDVLAESRGKKENKQLANAYRYIYQKGTNNVPSTLFQERLTSREIKIKPKSDNIAGLQLADLIAHPSCKELICRRKNQEMTADFGKQIVEILYRKKYLRSPFNGVVQGWGTKTLP
jgi:hypothetical protein